MIAALFRLLLILWHRAELADAINRAEGFADGARTYRHLLATRPDATAKQRQKWRESKWMCEDAARAERDHQSTIVSKLLQLGYRPRQSMKVAR